MGFHIVINGLESAIHTVSSTFRIGRLDEIKISRAETTVPVSKYRSGIQLIELVNLMTFRFNHTKIPGLCDASDFLKFSRI